MTILIFAIITLAVILAGISVWMHKKVKAVPAQLTPSESSTEKG